MIEPEDIHHVSLPVGELERSKRFYGEVLGLREIERPPFDYPGAWYAIGERQLHLIVRPGSGAIPRDPVLDNRDGHVALRVRSYRRALEHLRALGVPLRAKPENRTPWPQIVIADPDGHVIELNAAALD